MMLNRKSGNTSRRKIMEQRQTISQIAECVISEMERMQYSQATISTFRMKAKLLSRYVQEKTGADYFTEELGQRYLADTIGFPFSENRWLTSPESAHIRCVRRIGEYQLYGAVLRNYAKKSKILGGWELGDKEIITAYVESVQTADNSEATKKLRVYHIRQFYEFLASRKISGIHDISAQIISDYAASLQGESPVYTKHRLATLRFYFRFLRQNGILEYDWSFAVPKVIAPRNRNVPALWEKDDLERLLKGIDRGSPAGKRDYAIILLVVELGLRISDVSELRLGNLKWERNELELIQHKTGNRVTQPLLEDVGWAIIDYIRYARPNVELSLIHI